MIDDSELFHGNYDPVKAREYYLRTRKLKGRKKGSSRPAPGQRVGARPPARRSGGKANRSKTKSRRAELQAQKAALEKRLDRLREVLKQRVKAAKARSGASNPSKPKAAEKKATKGTAPETAKDKADRNSSEKKAKPLTSGQKREKAKKAKKAYEKEHPTSLSEDVEILREQIKDIQAKIQRATKDASKPRKTAGKEAAMVRPKAKTSSGPKGR